MWIYCSDFTILVMFCASPSFVQNVSQSWLLKWILFESLNRMKEKDCILICVILKRGSFNAIVDLHIFYNDKILTNSAISCMKHSSFYIYRSPYNLSLYFQLPLRCFILSIHRSCKWMYPCALSLALAKPKSAYPVLS